MVTMARLTTELNNRNLRRGPAMAEFKSSGVEGCKFKKVGYFLVGPRLAECSFGEIRLAVHIGTREKVAVKVVPKKTLVDLSAAQVHFRREVLVLQCVRHPNLARFYGTMETVTCYYLVHELVTGGHLLGRLATRGRLSEGEGRLYFRQMTAAVDHLHQSDIVHRNLKLESFLLDEKSNIKLVGFGASAVSRDHDLQLSTQCGSPLYAAPELFAGRRYGKPVDVWSLGVCLFAMLVGRLPFLPGEGSSLAQLRTLVVKGCPLPSCLSSESCSLLLQMLEPDDGLRVTCSGVVAHPWLATDHKLPQRAVIDQDLKFTSRHGSNDVENHQTSESAPPTSCPTRLEDPHPVSAPRRSSVNPRELAADTSPPELSVTRDCDQGGPLATSGKEESVSRQTSQDSCTSSSKDSCRTLQTGISQESCTSRSKGSCRNLQTGISQDSCTSSSKGSCRTLQIGMSKDSVSYKSSILQLKHLRQSLQDKTPSPTPRNADDFFKRGPPLAPLTFNGTKRRLDLHFRDPLLPRVRQQALFSSTIFSKRPTHNVSNDFLDYKTFHVSGVTFSPQNVDSLSRTPTTKTLPQKPLNKYPLHEEMSSPADPSLALSSVASSPPTPGVALLHSDSLIPINHAYKAKPDNVHKQVLNKQVLDKQVLDKQVLDKQVLDKQVLDKQVLDKQVLDKQVLDKQVLDKQVLDKQVLIKQVLDKQVLDKQVLDTSLTSPPEGETTLPQMLPRDVIHLLGDPFGRDVWDKNRCATQSWRSGQQGGPAGDAGRQRTRHTWLLPEFSGRRWPRKVSPQGKHAGDHSFRDQYQFGEDLENSSAPHHYDNISGIGTNRTTDLSTWHTTGRERTNSPRPDLEDFPMPVTRVVITHS